MGKSVLIVDDSRASRMMIRHTLSYLPDIQSIREADGGESALTLYQDSPSDLVLLDLTMEGMNGFMTLEKLKEIDPEVKVLVISANIQAKARERVFALGALDFISKPFNREQLKSLVHNALNYESEL